MTRASAALLAALLLTAANAAKPLVIDDPVYVAFARQILAHPGDPYGFELYWYSEPEPAMRFGTIPPVLPYWLAGSMALFGDHPVAWKLSLFPFALALTGSLAFLLGRWARPIATPVVFAIALGPTVLPGFNLMLDIPALALGLSGYALCVLACERRSAALALASGLVLGLALQTKYTAVLYPVLAFAHAGIHRRPREGALALAVAGLLFVGWEALIVAGYGQSHFLAGIERVRTLVTMPAVRQADAERPGTKALYWILCLLSLLGSTAFFSALLALVGLGARRFAVAGAALAAALAFVALLALPVPPDYEPHGFFALVGWLFPEIFLYAPLGLCVLGTLGAVAARLLAGARGADARTPRVLLLWLLLELAGFFAISPYPAARRVIGIGVAATLLAAHAASRRMGEPDARAGVAFATAFGLALGAIFFGAELGDALARRALVARAVERLPHLGARPPQETVWYIGHWEVQFYAERAGLRPALAGESQLRARDWMLVPHRVTKPPIRFGPDAYRLEEEIPATSPWPWSTLPEYYDGPVPLRRQPEAQAVMRILRVTRDGVPELQPPAPPPPLPR